MKTCQWLILPFILVVFYSCQKNNFIPENQELLNLEEKTAGLIKADNAFGLELFQTIRTENKEKNLLVSPFSVSVALAMAYNGANAETQAEMEKTMKLNGLSREQINNSYQQLISALQSLDEEVTFELANAIYYAEKFRIKQEFLAVTRKVYNAAVTGLDFNSPLAVKGINNWVNEKTHGKITEIINQLNPSDRMVLLNAIYFYGTWANEFDQKGTHLLEFIQNGGNRLEVPMMNKIEKLPYQSTETFEAVKMPYGNGQYHMVVLLPKEGFTPADIIGSFSAGNWNKWMAGFTPTDRVEVTMPRFKFAFETSLKSQLAAMGMQQAFMPETADFTGITEEDLFISEVRHKTFIDVNETGTEAAAVTSVTFTTTSLGNEPPTVPFFVNRPFLFAVTENKTGAILFLGEVNTPQYD